MSYEPLSIESVRPAVGPGSRVRWGVGYAGQARLDAATGFRRDIEGLRGVAVLLVVLYHAGVPGFAGGFVGVDVFFALSGYLITGLVVREVESTGTLDFARFYARRARRLLPAAALVLLATLGAGLLVYAPDELRRLANTGIVVAAYLSNFWFAGQSTDYLAGGAEESPLLHTWSLAVEEQFYFVWPVLIFLVMRGGSSRRQLAAAMIAVTAVSLGTSVFLTHYSQPWAFFGPLTRAWEFAAGALAVLVPRSVEHRIRPVAAPLALCGGCLLALAVVSFGPGTPFPGALALVPVIGTVAILLAGGHGEAGAQLRLLGSPGLQWVGRMSYCWYLWHWPVLAYAGVLVGDLSWPAKLALSGAALGLSQITVLLLESPIRHSSALAARPRAVLASAVALTAVSVGMAGLLRAHSLRAMELPSQRLYTEAYRDRARVYRDGCHLGYFQEESPACIYGAAASSRSIVLLGDSHAAHWFPALERIAATRGLRLVSLTKSACPAADVSLPRVELGRAYHECERWRRASMERVRELRPELVVVASYNGHVHTRPTPPEAGKIPAEEWGRGLRRTLSELDAAGIRSLLLIDTPRPSFEAPTCLARQAFAPLGGARGCSFPASTEEDRALDAVEREAARGLRYVAVVDMADAICATDPCPVIQRGRVVYSDSHHLTASFAATLAPVLALRLDE